MVFNLLLSLFWLFKVALKAPLVIKAYIALNAL
jgi:hypothetical protein